MSVSSPITSTTSRKGGVHHTLSEWYTSPLSSSSASSSSSNAYSHDATLPSPDRIAHRSLSISQWTITSSRGAIGNSAYMDQLTDRLKIPPPEMVFPSNRLTLRHLPSGFEYSFEAEKALRCVDGVSEAWKIQGMDLSQEWRGEASNHRTSGSSSAEATTSTKVGNASTHFGEKPKKKPKGIKVAYADEWGKSREPSSSVSSMNPAASSASSSTPPTTAFGSAAATQIADARDYDWTFSTTWAGEVGDQSSSSISFPATSSSSTTASTTPPPSSLPAFVPGTDPSVDRIPVERLGPSSGEPILFYDDLVLFEDELGDNGSSMLGVKVRVMPSGFLVLQRFLLRVDDVVFRLFDTRMYCAFNEEEGQKAQVGASRAAPPATAPWASSTATAAAGQSQQTESADATGRLPSLGGLSLGAPRRNGASASSSTVHTPVRAGGGATPATSEESVGSSSSSTASQRLIRECSGCEAPYKDVKARLPAYRPNDLSMLTDPNWVSQTLQTLAARQFAAFQSTNLTPRHQEAQRQAQQQREAGPTSGFTSSSASSPIGFSSSYSSSSIQPPSRGGPPPPSSPSQGQGQRQAQQPPNTLLAQALAPARLPSMSSVVSGPDANRGATSASMSGGILGEIETADLWEGVGGRVDVVTFPSTSASGGGEELARGTDASA